jgi:glycosyltransferase involved in cell wall biosynthesis
MKVLLLTQVLPYPPDSGPKVKTWNVLKYLAQRHEVTLVSFVRGDQSAEVSHLKQFCRAVLTVPITRGAWRDGWFMIRSLVTRQPFLMVRDDRAAMQRLIEQVTAQTRFDIIHVDQLNMAQYAERVNGVGRILDAHNALWLLYKRLWETMSPGPKKWLLGRDWRLLRQYEGEICRRFEGLLTVSEEDKAALGEAADRSLNATVIPIAVDTDEILKVSRCAEADHILHIGTMFWPPNIDGILWFLRDIFPLIQVRRPEITFDVVGARPPPEIMAYGGSGSGVNVAGYVVDPTPYYEATGVMVVPLRAGGGMRVKILNALAQGLPIVSTTLGCEGIAVEPGRHLLVADTPEDFARATLRLLEDTELANELGHNGRQLVQSTYDFRVACQPLETLYRQAISPRNMAN